MGFSDRMAMRFPELWQCLCNARRIGHLANVFLIQSDSAATREDFAVALTMLAVCPDVQSNGAPCGKCRYCEKEVNINDAKLL